MRYHNITFDDMLNGEGLRVVLWVSGCEHHCKNCQNEITWDVNDGLIFDKSAENELYEHLSKSYISGITFSGGDPLHIKNREEIYQLSCRIRDKFPNKTQWLYTGYNWFQVCGLPIMKNIDVLVDGKFIEEQKDVNLHWKGSANQNVIDVKQSLENGRVIIYE